MYVFGGVGCLAAFVASASVPSTDGPHSLWVHEFLRPDSLLDARTGWFYLRGGRPPHTDAQPSRCPGGRGRWGRCACPASAVSGWGGSSRRERDVVGRAGGVTSGCWQGLMPQAPAGPILVEPASAVPSLTAALRLAKPGDAVLVLPGNFGEPRIVVAVPVTILGRGKSRPSTARERHEILTITADRVTHSAVSACATSGTAAPRTGRRSGWRACAAAPSSGDRIIEACFGIYAAQVPQTVSSPTTSSRVVARLRPPRATPIHLFQSDGFTVARDRIHGHRDGVCLEFSPRARIFDDESAANLRYGLQFHVLLTPATIAAADSAGNGAGVAVMYSRAITMIGGPLRGRLGAGSLRSAAEGDQGPAGWSGNVLSGNSTGICAEGSDRIVIAGSRFLGNGWAVRLMADATDDGFRPESVRGRRLRTWRPTAATAAPAASPRTTGTVTPAMTSMRDGCLGTCPTARCGSSRSWWSRASRRWFLHAGDFFLDLLDLAERVRACDHSGAPGRCSPSDALERLVTAALARAGPPQETSRPPLELSPRGGRRDGCGQALRPAAGASRADLCRGGPGRVAALAGPERRGRVYPDQGHARPRSGRSGGTLAVDGAAVGEDPSYRPASATSSNWPGPENLHWARAGRGAAAGPARRRRAGGRRAVRVVRTGGGARQAGADAVGRDETEAERTRSAFMFPPRRCSSWTSLPPASIRSRMACSRRRYSRRATPGPRCSSAGTCRVELEEMMDRGAPVARRAGALPGLA